MKVISKQHNSRMCAICGLDNPYGVKAPFYNMEDRSVMTIFRYRDFHQSYPGRVHGGLISAMIDEMGLRGLWAWCDGNEADFGVTVSLESSFRKPVPYETDLIGRGLIVKESARAFTVEAEIIDASGVVLANGTARYLRLPVAKIAGNSDVHAEMPYCISDDVKTIL